MRTRTTAPADDKPFAEAPWTLVGPGSVIHGELLLAGNLVVHGRVEGTIFTDGEVRIAAGGSVEGGVHARRVTVLGSCEGRVEATEEVVLRPGGIMRGDVDAELFLVDEGARFFGNWIRNDRRFGPRILSTAKVSGTA